MKTSREKTLSLTSLSSLFNLLATIKPLFFLNLTKFEMTAELKTDFLSSGS